MQYFDTYNSPIGKIIITADETSLTGVWFSDGKFYDRRIETEYEKRKLPIFDTTKNWLDIYFLGHKPDFMPPINMLGSDFRISVWKLLLKIPYGSTTTYSKLAEILAKEKGIKHMSAQAIGSAVGHNPISIIIPCHRVVGTDGSLTGYANGIENKFKLLNLEGVNMENLFIPSKGTAL